MSDHSESVSESMSESVIESVSASKYLCAQFIGVHLPLKLSVKRKSSDQIDESIML